MAHQRPLTILLIDDTTEDRVLYRHFLRSEVASAYVFLEAATGEDGLRLCETTRPDCLVLDFHLPDMTGLEFLGALHTEIISLPYPVVMLTGQGSEQIAVQAMHRGVQDYLVKSDLSADTLRRAIRNAVDKFRLHQRLEAHRRRVHQQNLELGRREKALQALNTALEQQVGERTALLALLQAVTAAANEATSPAEALQFAVDRICAYTGWPVGHVYLPASDGSDLWGPTTIWHLDPPARFAAFQQATQTAQCTPGEGMIGRVITSGQPEWGVDVVTDTTLPSLGSVAQEAGLTDGFVFPILVDREVVGVFAFCADQSPVPDAALLDALRQIGIQLRRVVERQRAAEQLQRQQEVLSQREKLAAMGSLLASVAHELNNPLAVVMMHADLLQEEIGSGPLMEVVEEIAQAAERCKRLVRNFLTLARQHAPERAALALNTLITETVELLAYALRVDNITVRLCLAEHLPRLWADPHQLQQVVTNLLTNAHQALRDSSVPRQLTLITRCNPARTRIICEVADTSPGMPPALQARIFEPFFTTKPLGVGTGLGLSLCRGIIEGHGGTISVTSQPGRGATFRVELPVEARPGTASDPPELARQPVVHDKAILIIDDEPSITHGLGALLRRDGYDVEMAADGYRALAKLQERSYDLLLSDLRMPELDGPGLYRTLERQYPHLLQRVIFLTGDTLNPETRLFLEQSGAPCLTKPCTVAEIRRVIQQALRVVDPRCGVP
jgi:signal transduction histidine kinase/DNA-binding response OmpR family regulator